MVEAISLPIYLASDVVSVAAGETHSFFIKTDGTLWGMGANAYGQIGIGLSSCAVVGKVFVASNVVAVAAGENHSLFVKDDGTLWAMGRNNSWQLGTGTKAITNTLPVCVASDVVTATAGGYHSLFQKANGSVWGMGGNVRNQLGLSELVAPTPVQLAEDGVASAVAGDWHTLLIKTDGTLWGMGLNMRGQLGLGTTNEIDSVVLITNNVVSATGGNLCSLLAKTDGTVWSMGQNLYGRLGTGTAWDTDLITPTQVLCEPGTVVMKGSSATHTLAIGLPLAEVTVSTPIGTTDPAAGTYLVRLGTVFTNVLLTAPLLTEGTTQYVCTGWAMTGATPASGSGTTAIATVTNDTAVLTWLWRTDYWLETLAIKGGTVSPPSCWVEAGTKPQLTATAKPGCAFQTWAGDTVGTRNPLTITMNGPKNIQAVFITKPGTFLILDFQRLSKRISKPPPRLFISCRW